VLYGGDWISLGAMMATTKKCESIQAAVIMPNKRSEKQKKNRNVRIKLNLHNKNYNDYYKEAITKRD
jgi:hypothetical protein